ncbi:MAG: preprotein translocase subunit SecE [Pseudomonadota bacterium]
MPKSKNRRKPKSNRPTAELKTDTQVVEAETTTTKSDRAEQATPKKKSASPLQFFRQVRAEMQKVTWTTRGETTVSTIMVLIMVAIMSLFFFTVDQFLRFIVPLILSLNLS